MKCINSLLVGCAEKAKNKSILDRRNMIVAGVNNDI